MTGRENKKRDASGMRRRTLGAAAPWLMAVAMLLAHALPAAAAGEAKAGDAATCTARDGGLPVSRIVEIDTASGPIYGDITKQAKEKSFLKPKEVVLTFDDGPMPWITGNILDTLDRFCAKATFFSVGKMAVAYPAMLRNVVARGHTLGAHTWSHPLNLKRLKHDKAMDEIERGFAAISLASGGNAAPFFRFPGLSDNAAMLDALQKRGIASFTVDVVTNDSFTSNPAKLVSTTLSAIEARQGGIVLFHDIKPATAKALPTIMAELKRRGYKIVHMRPKAMLQPLSGLAEQLQPVLAKKDPPQGQAIAKAQMLPFYGAVGPLTAAERKAADDATAVETLSPSPRDRTAAIARTGEQKVSALDTSTASTSPSAANRKSSSARKRSIPKGDTDNSAPASSAIDGWSTRIRRKRLSRPVFD